MNVRARKTLTALIAFALGGTAGWAQEDSEGQTQADQKPAPTLYTTVDEVSVYLIKPDGSQVDVDTHETVIMTRDAHQYLDRPPAFLEWPCGTSLAGGRGSSATFTLEDLSEGNVIAEVVRRWFEHQEVIDPPARWLNSEAHIALPVNMIDDYVEQGLFWYQSGPATDKMAALRPKILIIGLFYGTGQVVVDLNHLEALKEEYGGGDIPVNFEYQDENVVPVTYFGSALDPSVLMRAFLDQGIRAADVPWQFAGDYHVAIPTGELADLLDAPALDEISPDRRATLERELQERGFKAKPVNLSIIAGAEGLIADEAEKIRVAESLGFEETPVLFNFYSDASAAQHCGVAPPRGVAGALGTSHSDSGGPDTVPLEPPQEIRPPDPPQPELPVSGN